MDIDVPVVVMAIIDTMVCRSGQSSACALHEMKEIRDLLNDRISGLDQATLWSVARFAPNQR